MKAITYTRYGPPEVLSQRDDAQLNEIEKTVPKDNEVLVKAVTSSLLAANFFLSVLFKSNRH